MNKSTRKKEKEMNEKKALEIVNQTFLQIFGRENPFTLEEILSKFAFDVKLPQKVIDSLTGEETWSVSLQSQKYITQNNMEKYDEQKGWMIPKKEIKTLGELLNIWKLTNYTTTERTYDCMNVAQCDPLYTSENAYRCTDCRKSKNLVFSDGCGECQNIIACQRSGDSSYCLRVDDSGSCQNSYNVICSAKISNSIFIQDCNSLYECIFCSHIANKKYCIANMQYEKEEYMQIKKIIIDWILKK